MRFKTLRVPYYRDEVRETPDGGLCEPWCGGGAQVCSRASYEAGVRAAKAVAKRLGPGWEPKMNHNLGWFASVVSACGRIEVSMHTVTGRSHHDYGHGRKMSYMAALGQAGDIGHRWSEHGRTAEDAVCRVVATARRDLAVMEACLNRLPLVHRKAV